MMYDILELNSKVLVELREIAHSIGVQQVNIMKKPDLIFMILNQQPVKIKASVLRTQAKDEKVEEVVTVDTRTIFSVFYSIFKHFRNYFM